VEMLKNPDPDVQEHALDTLRWVLYHLGAMSVCFTGTWVLDESSLMLIVVC
jgi:hypothetical protein